MSERKIVSKTPVPVIKWVGGKRQLLTEIKNNMPIRYNKYFEPFFGGGALFFDLQPQDAVINDFNPQLINLYKQVKGHSKEFIECLNNWEIEYNCLENLKEKDKYYYAKRDEYNACLIKNEYSLQSAALLVFLNKTGFNGLYRVNKGGLYNVPSAHKENIHLYDENNIRMVSRSLKKAKIHNEDFEETCKDASTGDFVFFDSPYYDTFDTYQANGFSIDDHLRLHNLFVELTKKGVYCMMTNNSCRYIKDLYADYQITTIPVKRMINSDASNRTGEEVMITNYNSEGKVLLWD